MDILESSVFIDVQMANFRLQRCGILDLVEWIMDQFKNQCVLSCFLFFFSAFGSGQKYENKNSYQLCSTERRSIFQIRKWNFYCSSLATLDMIIPIEFVHRVLDQCFRLTDGYRRGLTGLMTMHFESTKVTDTMFVAAA